VTLTHFTKLLHRPQTSWQPIQSQSQQTLLLLLHIVLAATGHGLLRVEILPLLVESGRRTCTEK